MELPAIVEAEKVKEVILRALRIVFQSWDGGGGDSRSGWWKKGR